MLGPAKWSASNVRGEQFHVQQTCLLHLRHLHEVPLVYDSSQLARPWMEQGIPTRMAVRHTATAQHPQLLGTGVVIDARQSPHLVVADQQRDAATSSLGLLLQLPQVLQQPDAVLAAINDVARLHQVACAAHPVAAGIHSARQLQ